MRLYQPHRSLQQAQSSEKAMFTLECLGLALMNSPTPLIVRSPGDVGACFLDPVFPAVWTVDSVLAQRSTSRIQRQQVGLCVSVQKDDAHQTSLPQDCNEESHVRCNRDFPHVVRPQEGKLYQARSIPCVFLLLSLPVSPE